MVIGYLNLFVCQYTYIVGKFAVCSKYRETCAVSEYRLTMYTACLAFCYLCAQEDCLAHERLSSVGCVLHFVVHGD